MSRKCVKVDHGTIFKTNLTREGYMILRMEIKTCILVYKGSPNYEQVLGANNKNVSEKTKLPSIIIPTKLNDLTLFILF